MDIDLDISRFLVLNRKFDALYNKLTSKTADELGITKPEFDVLCFLNNNKGLDTARDIAQRRGFSRAYVSRAVDLLCRRGYLVPDVSREDRRYQHLTITPEAAPCIEAILRTQHTFIRLLSVDFTQEETDALYKIVGHLLHNIEQSEQYL